VSPDELRELLSSLSLEDVRTLMNYARLENEKRSCTASITSGGRSVITVCMKERHPDSKVHEGYVSTFPDGDYHKIVETITRWEA
jgi:hypothetical protein